MSDGTDVYPNVEPNEDKVYRITEAIFSLIPMGQPILHSLITPPIQKRTEKWIAETETRLLALEEAGEIDIVSLLDSELFSAVVLKCLQTVATTSQSEKLEQLSNFVTNLSKEPDFEEDEVHILFGILNEFTPSHVLVLKFYCFPEQYANQISRLSSSAPKANLAQGVELAQIFGGEPEYWQSIFSTANVKVVVSSLTTSVKCSATMERTVSGRGTKLGLKLLSLLDT